MSDAPWDSDAHFIGEMILEGAARALEWENGELFISWNEEILKFKYPEVYETMLEVQMDEIAEALDDMVEKGLVEREPTISPEGELDTLYSLTDLGKDYAREMGLDPPDEA